MKRAFVACILGATMACQSYSTVALSAVPVGADVQVALTDSGSSAVAAGVGRHAQQLDGKVTQSDATGITLSVSELTRTGGTTELGEGRLVSVPADAIATIRVQSLSVSRTLLTAGAIVAASLAVGRSLGGGSGTSVHGGGPPPTGH